MNDKMKILKGIENGAKEVALYLDGKIKLNDASHLFSLLDSNSVKKTNKKKVKTALCTASNNQQLPTNN